MAVLLAFAYPAERQSRDSCRLAEIDRGACVARKVNQLHALELNADLLVNIYLIKLALRLGNSLERERR